MSPLANKELTLSIGQNSKVSGSMCYGFITGPNIRSKIVVRSSTLIVTLSRSHTRGLSMECLDLLSSQSDIIMLKLQYNNGDGHY